MDRICLSKCIDYIMHVEKENNPKSIPIIGSCDIPQLETIPFIAGWTDFHLNDYTLI